MKSTAVKCRLPDALKLTSFVRFDQAKTVVLIFLQNSSDSSQFPISSVCKPLTYLLKFQIKNFAIILLFSLHLVLIQTERIAIFI